MPITYQGQYDDIHYAVTPGAGATPASWLGITPILWVAIGLAVAMAVWAVLNAE